MKYFVVTTGKGDVYVMTAMDEESAKSHFRMRMPNTVIASVVAAAGYLI